MDYRMPDITSRCKKDFNYTDEDMIILEREFKRYIILSVINNSDSAISMYSKDVDNLWHTFILFTRNYLNFCNKYTGRFIHHIPKTDFKETLEKIKKRRKNLQAFIKSYEETFKEDVHPIWFLSACENK